MMKLLIEIKHLNAVLAEANNKYIDMTNRSELSLDGPSNTVRQ